MKKLLLFAACIAILTSCNKPKEEEKVERFLATGVDTLIIHDGAYNKIPIRMFGKFGFPDDSLALINRLVNDTDDYADFVQELFNIQQLRCNYSRTYVPQDLGELSITDSMDYNGEKIYKFRYYAIGTAKNAYGVEGSIADMYDAYGWHEITEYKDEETGNIRMTTRRWYLTFVDRNNIGLNSLKELIDKYLERKKHNFNPYYKEEETQQQ